jgi:hypothetical protein
MHDYEVAIGKAKAQIGIIMSVTDIPTLEVDDIQATILRPAGRSFS